MKGQATYFVIFGIIVVGIIALILFLKEVPLAKEKVKAIAVPEQVRPVKDALDSCIRDVASEGANLLGLQGGYIDLPPDSTPRGIVNPFSSNLKLFSRNDLVVPYWYYLKSNNVEKTQIPSIRGMESELGSYIDERLDNCLNRLNQFRNKGYGINVGKANTGVNIESEKIIVRTKLPTTIALKDFIFNLDGYENAVEIPLGKLYHYAQKILEKENTETFLENKTLDFMVVYDEIPYSGMDLECTPKTWTKSQVYKDFKDILEVNVPLIRIKGTSYSLKSEEGKYYEIDNGIRDSDLAVNFQYSSEWPFFMEVISHPKDELLMGEPYTINNAVARYLASLFCLNYYNFVYNIKYPVLISLASKDFVFQFATLIVIDHNQPRENQFTINEAHDDNSIICNNPAKEITVNALAAGEGNSLVPLKNARISYECVSSVCEIGATKQDASLVAKFPQCLNGVLIAESDGYHAVREPLSTNQEQIVTVILEPYYEVKPIIYVVEGNSVRNLSNNEEAIFVLEEPDKDYGVSITKNLDKVKLIAGDYHVTSYLMQNSTAGFRIDGKDVETCVERPKKSLLGFLGATEKECKTVKLDSYELEQALTGGAEFDFRVDRDDLAKAKTITLYTIREGVPSTTEELTKVNEKISQNIKNPNFELPEVK